MREQIVKELVENAIDAGSTQIDVRLEDSGLKAITVRDNGSGISRENHAACARRYYTSKLRAFEDLESLASLGFRGEALNSICNTADVVILTKTAADEVGYRLTFDSEGNLQQTAPSPLGVGTTVTASRAFSRTPVRLQTVSASAKQQVRRITDLITHFALIHSQVRFSLKAPPQKEMIFLPSHGAQRQNAISTAFGPQLLPLLKGFAVEDTVEIDGRAVAFSLDGYLPASESDVALVTRTAPERTFLSLNSRPVDLPFLTRAIYASYRAAHAGTERKYPFVFANLSLPSDCFDVNVTPSKRTVLFQDELCAAIVAVLEQRVLRQFYTHAGVSQDPAANAPPLSGGSVPERDSEDPRGQGAGDPLSQAQHPKLQKSALLSSAALAEEGEELLRASQKRKEPDGIASSAASRADEAAGDADPGEQETADDAAPWSLESMRKRLCLPGGASSQLQPSSQSQRRAAAPMEDDAAAPAAAPVSSPFPLPPTPGPGAAAVQDGDDRVPAALAATDFGSTAAAARPQLRLSLSSRAGSNTSGGTPVSRAEGGAGHRRPHSAAAGEFARPQAAPTAATAAAPALLKGQTRIEAALAGAQRALTVPLSACVDLDEAVAQAMQVVGVLEPSGVRVLFHRGTRTMYLHNAERSHTPYLKLGVAPSLAAEAGSTAV
eukprot:TRINITY_DN7090_c0_g1_i3.p1 TRINITY_DN7090_c0_g1~~TRINITY_DN7090_c0_g1_i3.p1  ORF type:complete len:704 (-),score=181.40 TRINITY_DN7090_c0_g1_i3:17-2011(-)